MPLPTRETEDDALLYAFGGRELPSTLAESIGATVRDPRLRPTQLLSEYQQEDPERFRRQTALLSSVPVVEAYIKAVEAFGYAFPLKAPEPDDDEMLTPEQVKASFGHLGVSFDRPVSRRVAEMTARRRQEDMHREEIIAASPQSLAAKGVRFGAALLGAAVDPLNIASAFIPVMRETTFARIAAQSGITTARLAAGASGGFVGALAVEPLTYGLSRQLQLDYSMGDALLNIALGTAIGAGLHVGVGAIGDRLAARPEAEAPPVQPDFVATASPEAREGAIRAAVAQFAEGRPVDVAPIFGVDRTLREAVAEEIQALTPEIKAAAVAEHKQAIERIAEARVDWDAPPPAPPEVKVEFGLQEAEAFDTAAIEALERAMIEARPETQLAEAEAPAPAKAPKAKKAKPAKPLTAYQFIERMGGMQDLTGELKSMDLPRRRFGKYGIINPKGMHPDKVREALVEAGYLPPEPKDAPPVSTIDDVYELLAKHQAGQPVYSRQEQALVDAMQAEEQTRLVEEDRQRALETIDDYLAENVPAMGALSEAERLRAYELYQQGMEADDILERIAIESEADVPQPLYEEALDDFDIGATFGAGESAAQGRGGREADAAAKARPAKEVGAAQGPRRTGEEETASLPEGVEPPPDFPEDIAFSFEGAAGGDETSAAQLRPAAETDRLVQAILDRLPPNIKVMLDYPGEALAAQAEKLSGLPVKRIEDGYSRSQATLIVTTHALDRVKTLRHEEVHALRSLGLFTEQEWAVLAERAGKLAPETEAQYRAWHARRYTGKRLEESLQEEAVARMIEHYEAGARYGTVIDAIIERIRKFFEALRNAARGLGFQTADDIIRRIETGEIGRRAQTAPRSQLGVEASMRNLFPSEMTPEGEQYIIPGTEKISQKQLAERKFAEPLKAKVEQKESPGPLFEDKQTDLIEQIRLKRADENVQKAQDIESAVMQAARCMSVKGLL